MPTGSIDLARFRPDAAPTGRLRPHQVLRSHKAAFEAALADAREPVEGRTLTAEQFAEARALLASDPQRFGLPSKDKTQYVFMSSNIRKLGAIEKKTAGAWQILADWTVSETGGQRDRGTR